MDSEGNLTPQMRDKILSMGEGKSLMMLYQSDADKHFRIKGSQHRVITIKDLGIILNSLTVGDECKHGFYEHVDGVCSNCGSTFPIKDEPKCNGCFDKDCDCGGHEEHRRESNEEGRTWGDS